KIHFFGTPVNYTRHFVLRAQLAGGSFAKFGPQLSFDCNCFHLCCLFCYSLFAGGFRCYLLALSLRMNKQACDALVFISIPDSYCKKFGNAQYFYFFRKL